MNSTSITLSTEDHKNLETLLAALPDQRDLVSVPDCNTYKTYRPILQVALPLIQKIPVFGSKIFTALTFLMQLADGVCQVSQVSPITDTKTSTQLLGKLTIEKISENELRVTFPQGTAIKSSDISEADLYFALSRDLLKAPSKVSPAACVLVAGPVCVID